MHDLVASPTLSSGAKRQERRFMLDSALFIENYPSPNLSAEGTPSSIEFNRMRLRQSTETI